MWAVISQIPVPDVVARAGGMLSYLPVPSPLVAALALTVLFGLVWLLHWSITPSSNQLNLYYNQSNPLTLCIPKRPPRRVETTSSIEHAATTRHAPLPNVAKPPSTTQTLPKRLAARCPSLTDKAKAIFTPSRWLFNGHLQTAAVTKLAFFKGYDVDYHRELVSLPDGGAVALDWYPSFEEQPDSSIPIVLILHGLTGGSHEFYVRALVQWMTAAPYHYRAVVMNNRGCGFSELLTPQMYSAGYTDDLRFVLNRLHRQFPDTSMLAAGFSLGANILVKYLGEEEGRCFLQGAVAVGNPFNMLKASEILSEGLLGSLIYTKVMRNNLVRAFLRHKQVFNGSGLDVDLVAKSRTLYEFDDLMTRRMFGFETVRDYYISASSSPWVRRVRVPLLCLNSLDDPICSFQSIPFQDCINNPYVVLATTAHGGHLGWFETGADDNQIKPWWTKPVGEFIAALEGTQVVTSGAQAR
ncbi:hypothetical protein H4R34_002815 [Dimargaris verticillata]|uniref:AB hydrolase-1 domain-containing protein n=1 Tax=Dimargaris verticillata TaxID=2761393 RepID=A0A9W8EDR3_9FUNG|nr:hypothetical protein H4R34_002815 [Dimargaris verticillata]